MTRQVDRVVTWTRWGFTDAVAAMNCPKCKQPAGQNCRTPKGRKAWPPHAERFNALVETGYIANRITLTRGSDL